jgi:DNA-binding CsgD family transcriptional regulator
MRENDMCICRRQPRRARGEWTRLTPHEAEVARLVADGLTNKEVGARLFMAPKTVEHHLTRIFRKLGVRRRVELARLL